jgi:hypothetical protein
MADIFVSDIEALKLRKSLCSALANFEQLAARNLALKGLGEFQTAIRA